MWDFIHKPLVTPEEAVKLSQQLPDFQGVGDHAEAIYRAAEEFHSCKSFVSGDRRWVFYASIHAVFVAGRIQGIREERRRNETRRLKKLLRTLTKEDKQIIMNRVEELLQQQKENN